MTTELLRRGGAICAVGNDRRSTVGAGTTLNTRENQKIRKSMGGFYFFTAAMLFAIMVTSVCSYGQELRPVKGINKKWGFVDGTGKEIIPFKYDMAVKFSEGLAAVKLKEKWGFIDTTGKEVIPFKFWRTGSFSEGLAAARYVYGGSGFIDKTGKEVIPFEFQWVGNFSEGLAAVQRNNKWGFIDKMGKLVIPLNYKNVGKFSEGLAAVQCNNKWGAIDKNGTMVVSCIYGNMHNAFIAGITEKEVREREKEALEQEKAAVLERERIALEREKLALEREKLALGNEKTEPKPEVINPAATGTYDVILLKDGQEIKAQVTEITPSEIKYKAFDNLNGPTRTLAKRDVFLINYANGTREVITTAAIGRNGSAYSNTNCAKNTAFGLDIGLGGSFYANHNNRTRTTTSFAPALGIRVMHHFNPYFGVDFVKINWITDVFHSEMDEGWTMRLQIMPGIRGNSPAFFKCMSVYSVFRLGYGMDFRLATLKGASHYEGLCLETELGLNLTPTVFAGFAYNCHQYFVKGIDSKVAMHTLSFRVGFNFGK